MVGDVDLEQLRRMQTGETPAAWAVAAKMNEMQRQRIASLEGQVAALRFGNDELRKEVERLRDDCADLYQIVAAAMLDDPVEYTGADVVRVLDNLNAAASGEPRPHKLRPWPNAKHEAPL